MVCIVSSKPARATQKDHVSQREGKKRRRLGFIVYRKERV